jgi:phosphoribosylanthranilate isomerase
MRNYSALCILHSAFISHETMTKIKICGITVLKDALAAINAGADMLGFNFYPKSPRYLAPQVCREITSVVRKDFPQITLVGVFVNAPVAEIRSILETAQLHLAQLHGDETPEMLAELGPLAFKAIRLPSSVSVPPAFIRDSVKESVFILVDAAVKGMYGGSGVVADWSAAAQLARRIPLLLAGGLTPENVSAALEQVHPWGVDVASGVEASPGVKDPAKMRRFVEAVRKTQ